MPLSYLRDEGYNLGMIRDTASWQIPNGGVYDSLNLLSDQPTILRSRLGSTALVSGAQTAFATSLGFCYSQDGTNTIEELHAVNGKTGDTLVINKTTGAATVTFAGGASINVGRSVKHFGFVAFPVTVPGSALRQTTFASGQTTSTTFTNAAVAQVAAGDPIVTLTGADTTTNVKVGATVNIFTATQNYYGRVVSISTTKKFFVTPPPTFTDAAVPIGLVFLNPAYVDNGGACAASFQNRFLVGNTNDLAAVNAVITDRRVYYSPLPTESFVDPASALTISGSTFMHVGKWPKLNYFEVPGADPIVAMEPVNENALLILTGNQPVILDGDLATQLATTSPTITFDESSIMQPAGCLSDLSVQRTPRGIVWAGVGGIYAFNGGREIADLTDKRINSFWRTLTSDATLVIHGAAYVRNHYIVSGTSGGTTFSFAVNMNNLQWTRLSGVGTDVFTSVARPSVQSQVFAARWWDQTGAAPSMTNGQTVRLESMFAKYTAGATTTDADGTAITSTVQTRTITGDSETQKNFQRLDTRYQQASTTAAMTVTAQSTIDAADVNSQRTRSLGSLSNTETRTVSSATNANPIVITTSTNHGYQSDDFVDIDGVTGNTNANGRWRIVVTGATTFSLIGGIGNGAGGGSPTVKKITEQAFLASPLNAGQGFSVTITGAPNYFEHHGIKMALLERPQLSAA